MRRVPLSPEPTRTRSLVKRAALLRRTLLALGAAGIVTAPAGAQERLKVVASFSILGDMVREVGGGHIHLATIVGPDQDTHAYQPTPRDARTLAAADVLFVNGFSFEGWIDRLVRAAPLKGRRVVLAERIAHPIAGRAAGETQAHGKSGHAHAHGALDPHAWQDIANARVYVAAITEVLAAADAASAELYRQHGAAYDRRLADLDRWVKEQIATVPANKRKVITGHDAFRYFARAYGVEFHAPVGINTDKEPSARQVANLIRQIKSQGIRAIFMENMSNPKLIEQIARDAGGVVGPALYVDALSGPGGPADTYEKMFRYNVSALVAGMLKN